MTVDNPPRSAQEDTREPVSPVPRLGAAASGVLSVLLVGSVVAVPLLGFVIAPLGLIPVLRYQAGGGHGAAVWGWVAGGLAVLAVASGSPVAQALLLAYVVIVVAPVLSVQLWGRLGWTEGRWAAVTALVATVISMVVIAAVSWPQAPVDALAEWARDSAAEAEELYRSIGVSQGELSLALDSAQRVVPWIVPSVPVVYLVAILFWIRPRLRILGFPMAVGPFERYRSEEWLPAGFAAAGLLTLVAAGTVRWLAINLLLTVLMLYFVHGLAIIRAHLARWVGRGWLVRWGVALLCIQPPFPLFMAILGVTDSFFQLRPPAKDDGGTT